MDKKIERKMHEIDATGLVAGRIATRAAMLLRGKHKASFEPRIDDGDIVVVVNASKMRFTGRKMVQKDYKRHTMYPGGLKTVSMKKVWEGDPTDILRRAVHGMLPKNRQRDERMKRLTIKA
jgi:large subunit ribosomal protein L13